MQIDRYNDENDVAVGTEHTKPVGGIYELPVIGSAAADVRLFYDEMARNESDSTKERVEKEVIRWGSFAVGTAVLSTLVL